VSPLLNSYSAELISYIESRAGAPVLMNTVTMTGDWDDPDTEYFNSQIVWQHGEAGEQYDKAHPIPFGEYVPDREFYEALAPDLIGLIQREYTPGTRSNVLDIDGTNYGVFICYDIVDDHLARAAVEGDAGVLLAPTNNADFGYSEESAQQLATARLRAVESGRPLVQASTVGWSAAFEADGTQIAGLEWYEPGAFVAEVTTGTGKTPAIAFGDAIDVLASGVGLAIVIAAPRRRD
jgi:apolipoprotein N-acyltransferase